MNEDIPLISDQASPSGMIVFKRPLTEIEGYTIRKLQLDGCSVWAIAMAFPAATYVPLPERQWPDAEFSAA